VIGSTRFSLWRRGLHRLHGPDPGLHRRGDELWSVVESDIFGRAAQNELTGQQVDHVGGLELPVNPDR